MPKQQATVTVTGGVAGPMWWPAGVTGWKEVTATYSLRGDDAPFCPRVESLREALERTVSEHDGDFQGGALTGDTWFEVTYHRPGGRRRSRSFNVADFPCLADIIDPDGSCRSPSPPGPPLEREYYDMFGYGL